MSADEIRERIHRLLNAAPVAVLPGEAPSALHKSIVKAGILPFLPAPAMENWRFLLMQPVAGHSHLGPPKLQLAKGTRMQHTGGAWQDIRGRTSGEAEALSVTALREGIEELGLDISGITRLFDAGPVGFISANTGAEKRMWLFGAQMQSEDCLLPADYELARTTARRAWVSTPEFALQVRADHANIILEAARRLAEAL